jgi:hypothetical protein
MRVRAKGPISAAASLWPIPLEYTMMAWRHGHGMWMRDRPIWLLGSIRTPERPQITGACNGNWPSVTGCSFYVYLGMSSPRCAIRGRTPRPRLQNTICTEL